MLSFIRRNKDDLPAPKSPSRITLILPIGFASSKFKKLNSWDSFLVTKPFAKCAFVWGNSIFVPKNCNENEIAELKIKLENEINICEEKAQKEINA